MEYQYRLTFLFVIFLVPCTIYVISAPIEPMETVYDLIQDKEIDESDQAHNIVDLAEGKIAMGEFDLGRVFLSSEGGMTLNGLLMGMGYMEEKVGFTADDLNKTEMNTQIANFQQNAGIKVTGTITGSTMVAVRSPRCGRPDVESSEDESRGKRYAIAGSRSKWKKNEITWRIGNWPSSDKITDKQVAKDIRAAFKIWSDVTPLKFVQIDRNDTDVDIRIEFMKKIHGDDFREPRFDGRGGTLAHAFYPNSGWGETDGDVHFDDDEDFTFKDKEFGTNLFYTAAHELGHSLGLQHSSNPNALMNPWDKGYVKNFKLPKDDVLGIQSIYGINPNMKPTGAGETSVESTTPGHRVTTEETAAHGDCENAKIAVAIIQKHLFVFQGENLWRYQGEHVNQRLLTPLHGYPIRRYFKDGPKSIDAAFTYPNGSAVFIRGKNMWVYDKRRMAGSPGQYPMRLAKVFGIPRDIDAAFHDNGIAYFFKDDQLWKYDTERNMLLTKASIPASEEFNGVPSPIGGAYSDHHGHRYLIKDQKYWQYDSGERNIASGYPRMFAFLDCH